ncbi:SOS response-associated peptidase [Methylomonas sp. MO1]|uniref:SOS response-associated peptidase n=1 Tax=Methylomonas sp. MO1 TaxID=3073619 RepID=UPI0028A45F81|nr:SOS response-associated peptidase [Methylomonas sp. MO1]MDT4292327.1 SOS response-associated peptidase [Methylomonas sp. MO1]
MCGRFTLTAATESIVEHFQLPKPPRFQASYNIAPAQKILCIVELEDKSLKAVNLFWGLVPSWSKDDKNSHHLINARAETIREKPSFRAAFHKRRCLIVASGFYEWQKLESGKQAFHIHRQDNKLFAFAGLWEHWEHEAKTLYSCTIITTQAAELMQPIHERMPVIMPTEDYRDWLNKTSDEQLALQLINNSFYSSMIATPISDYVNNPRHDDESCIQPKD